MSGRTSYVIDWFPKEPVELVRGKRYRIGRGGGNEFYLPDVHASREHADIEWKHDAFLLTDLGSSNGTFVNGEPVTEPVVLKDGDEIRVGTHVLRLRVEDAEKVARDYEATKKQVQEWQTVVHSSDEIGPEGAGGLSGKIEDVSLPQVMQMLEAGRKTGRLLVTAVGISASIYFRDGRVVAAVHVAGDPVPPVDAADEASSEASGEASGGASDGASGGTSGGTSGEAAEHALQGPDAVYAMLAIREGVFEFLAQEIDFETDMDEPVQMLLMEGLRRLDETARDETADDGRTEPGPEDTQKL